MTNDNGNYSTLFPNDLLNADMLLCFMHYVFIWNNYKHLWGKNNQSREVKQPSAQNSLEEHL
jgi:hypothetical protein